MVVLVVVLVVLVHQSAAPERSRAPVLQYSDNRRSLQKKAQPSPNPAEALKGAAARAAVGADATEAVNGGRQR